jgi:hypothetical protein
MGKADAVRRIAEADCRFRTELAARHRAVDVRRLALDRYLKGRDPAAMSPEIEAILDLFNREERRLERELRWHERRMDLFAAKFGVRD